MMRFLILSLLFVSCSDKTSLEGELYIDGRDTFTVHIDTLRVTGVKRLKPRNITEEASPRFRIYSGSDSFESNISYPIGTPKILYRLQRVNELH